MPGKLALPERPLYNVVTVYRSRGHYLQRLEQFEKAIEAYSEALRWNDADVPSLLGRSAARAKATYYTGALADASKAAELEPENLTALQMQARTKYEKCMFEKALVLAHRGQTIRKCPPDFADCARIAEETIRDCTNENARKVLSRTADLMQKEEIIYEDDKDPYAPMVIVHKSRMAPKLCPQNHETTRVEMHRSRLISRLMAAKYLERMAHDKHFLKKLCRDERLKSANKKDSIKMQELADTALADIEMRQDVLRERRPLYAARASESKAKSRLSEARKKQMKHAQEQHVTDAKRLIAATETMFQKRDTNKCLENAEFGMEQIGRKPANLLPGKDKFLHQLQNIVAETFLDQKRVKTNMSECDREKRAFVLLGIQLSREPSRDSVLRVRPPAPPRDAKRRRRYLERALDLSDRPSERCYIFHELARLYIDTKQSLKARYYAFKCQQEARASNHNVWLLNATFLLARGHVMQNNRTEARAALLEAAGLARNFRMPDVAEFFDTCVNVSTEGETESPEASLEERERAMISLMQDPDMKSEAQHLFRKMSVLPAQRRFSVLPGARMEEPLRPSTQNRRASIIPRSQTATVSPIKVKGKMPLGLQDFDY